MPENGVTAVDRALSIIEAYRATTGSLSLKDLAQKTGLNKATILRLIASLERFGYVQKVASGTYALGPTFLAFGSLYQSSFNLSEHVMPVLRALVDQTGCTAAFWIREADARVCLFRVATNQGRLASRVKVGHRRPLSLKGGGASVLLAFSTEPSESSEFTDIATKYLEVNIGGRVSEISSLAVPVFRVGQDLVGAISVSGPTIDFTDELIAANSQFILTAGKELTRQLGGNALGYETS
ncbi:MAG: DNA-binding IclR family transcriptional regulator [Gammaproteobacteria bacterium]|jgi:DNA-binding IclR family transcriptional regulator